MTTGHCLGSQVPGSCGTKLASLAGDVDDKSPLAKVLICQSVGFLVIIALTFLDELVALPSLVFSEHSFVFNFRESALKMLMVLAVWFLLIGSTRRILGRVRYLESFMRVCSWCRHIDYKGKWISMEDFLQQGFETRTTHGICPSCLAKSQAAYHDSKPPTADSTPGKPPPAKLPDPPFDARLAAPAALVSEG